jgi:hypothetical protein
MHGGDSQRRDPRSADQIPRARLTEEDVAELLASQPPSRIPGRLSAMIGDAIVAESVRRARDQRRTPARELPVSLPRPRASTALPSWEELVPLPRDARARA